MENKTTGLKLKGYTIKFNQTERKLLKLSPLKLLNQLIALLNQNFLNFELIMLNINYSIIILTKTN